MLQIHLLPFPVLQTERFQLRQISLADAPAIWALRTDDRTMKYIGKDKITSIAEAEAFIKLFTQALEENQGITWGIFRLEKSNLIGSLGFWQFMKAHHRAELGYMLLPAFWQQGIMSEVLPAVLAYGFTHLRLHSVEANVNPHNSASVRLLEKHSFVREGYFRENYLVRGTFQDTASYSLLQSEGSNSAGMEQKEFYS